MLQLFECCQYPELLLESSLEQHPEVGAANRGGAAGLDQSPSDRALSSKHFGKGHQVEDTWMGTKRRLLGEEGVRALLFPAQPSCLACCMLVPPCQA